MSAQLDQAPAKPLTFRRYKDGDTKPLAWQQEIFDADHSHKCSERSGGGCRTASSRTSPPFSQHRASKHLAPARR